MHIPAAVLEGVEATRGRVVVLATKRHSKDERAYDPEQSEGSLPQDSCLSARLCLC